MHNQLILQKLWKLQNEKVTHQFQHHLVCSKKIPRTFTARLSSGTVSAEWFALSRCGALVLVHLPSNLSMNSIRLRRVSVHLTLPPKIEQRVGGWRLNLKMNHQKIVNRAWKRISCINHPLTFGTLQLHKKLHLYHLLPPEVGESGTSRLQAFKYGIIKHQFDLKVGLPTVKLGFDVFS